MPCDDSHMEPKPAERVARETAKLLMYVLRSQKQPVPAWVAEEASNLYAHDPRLVPMLCARIRAMSKREQDRIVYNGRSAASRRLADWWEKHKNADAVREQALAKRRKSHERAFSSAVKQALAAGITVNRMRALITEVPK